MFGEARKLHLIEEILKIENEHILNEVETVIIRNTQMKRRDFKDFAGMMSDDEANELENIIKEECKSSAK